MSDNHNRGIYKIPKENLPKFQKMLEKLSKKAIKLTGERIYFVPFNTITEKSGDGYAQEYVEVLLSGFESPKLNGWSFVARLDHANEVGNIVRPVPGFVVPDLYRDRESVCEHCKINRYRRDTYLVRNDESGEIKQIGSSCLKDFLGHQHPEKIAKMAELLGYADELARGAMSVGEDRRFIDLEAYLAHVALQIDLHGYMSLSKARQINSTVINERDMVESTSSRALNSLFPNPRIADELPKPEDKHFDLAIKSIEWAANLGEDGTVLNDYQYNIHVLAASGVIEFRSTGYASSIVGAYMREHDLFPKREPKKVSNFVGKVKDKLELEVEFVNFWERDNDTGRFFIYRFADADGNVFTWMTGTVIEASKGDKLKLRGTVKDHNEYKGIKSTVLTRCKVVS
jgi:hypothetical protein